MTKYKRFEQYRNQGWVPFMGKENKAYKKWLLRRRRLEGRRIR